MFCLPFFAQAKSLPEGIVQIVYQIVGIFDSDRKAHGIGIDAARGEFFLV